MTLCIRQNTCNSKSGRRVRGCTLARVLTSTLDVVYGLVDKAQGKTPRSSYEYKNVGWESWLNELIAQEKEDETMAHQLSDRNNVADYKNLTGFYNKKSKEEEWKVKINQRHSKPKNREKKASNNNHVPQEDMELKVRKNTYCALLAIKNILKQINKAESRNKQKDRPKATESEEFPVRINCTMLYSIQGRL